MTFMQPKIYSEGYWCACQYITRLDSVCLPEDIMFQTGLSIRGQKGSTLNEVEKQMLYRSGIIFYSYSEL